MGVLTGLFFCGIMLLMTSFNAESDVGQAENENLDPIPNRKRVAKSRALRPKSSEGRVATRSGVNSYLVIKE